MFVLYLSPYGSRNREAPYLWVLYKALNHIAPKDLFVIASEDYFKDPSYYVSGKCWDVHEWAQWYGEYSLPSKANLTDLNKHVLSKDVFTGLGADPESAVERFRLLLTQEHPPLRDELKTVLTDLGQSHQIEAVLCWCNCPSLKAATVELGIPLIHNEFGPFRKGNYQHTANFDFEGVNGWTEAHRGSREFRDCVIKESFSLLSREEIKALIMDLPLPEATSSEPEYAVGVPLQIEDDSNVVAFSNGYDNARIIREAEQIASPGKVLVRKHPGGLKDYTTDFGDIDESRSSHEFILKCRKILTLNSSVGLEAILLGKPTYILGDCPFSMLSAGLVDHEDEHGNLICLNYLIFCYLIPYEFLFDINYYRWRLTNPELLEIYTFHLDYYYLTNSVTDSLDFEYIKTLPPTYGNALLRLFARSRSEKQEMYLSYREQEAIVEDLTSSLSWKITAPLRWGRGLLAKYFSWR